MTVYYADAQYAENTRDTDTSPAYDGESEANAWDIASAFENVTGEDTVWIKQSSSAYVPTVSLVILGSGSIAANSHVKFIGYHTTIGDMDLGGAYYQSALDAYINNVDTTKCVTIDGNGIATLISASSRHNIEFRNFYLTGIDLDTGWLFSNSGGNGNRLYNCKFGTGHNAIVQSSTVEIIDCYFAPRSGYNWSVVWGGMMVRYSVFDLQDSSTAGTLNYGCWIDSNIFLGGSAAFIPTTNNHYVTNNIFFNQTLAGFYTNNSSVYVTARGNIFVSASTSVKAISVPTGKGTVVCDYNLAYCSAGSLTIPFYSIDVDGNDMSGDNDQVNVDPQFRDADNGDFTPLNPLVITGGRPDTHNNAGYMGAVVPDIPALANVLTSDKVNGVDGTYHAPETSEVVDSATYGPASALTGLVHLPEASEVLYTAVFGVSSETQGTYTPDFPDVYNVRDGIVYANDILTGTYKLTEATTDDNGDVADLLNEFGETVRYWPGDGSDPRDILAVVDRSDPEGMPPASRGLAPKVTISVANSVTSGIASTEMDTGVDRIELATRVGKSTTKHVIRKLDRHDGGMLVLEVQ